MAGGRYLTAFPYGHHHQFIHLGLIKFLFLLFSFFSLSFSFFSVFFYSMPNPLAYVMAFNNLSLSFSLLEYSGSKRTLKQV